MYGTYVHTYLDILHGVEEQCWYLLPQPLVPGTVRCHALTGGGEVKVPLNDEAKAVASKRQECKYLLLLQILQYNESNMTAHILMIR